MRLMNDLSSGNHLSWRTWTQGIADSDIIGSKLVSLCPGRATGGMDDSKHWQHQSLTS